MQAKSNVAPAGQEHLHRLFFRGGILVVLTMGAVWGADILIRMARHGSFTAVGLHEINAHGHAQIFGWVGLFIMGFGYQVFARWNSAPLERPRWAAASFWMMLSGIVLRSVGEAALPHAPALVWPALVGAGLEIVAITLFAGMAARTVLAGARPLPANVFYVLCALGWFVAQALYDGVYFAATAFAAGREALLSLAANYQAPLRELQIYGLAMLMIFGVSQRILPHHYGMRALARRFSLTLLLLLNGGLVVAVAGYMLMRQAGHAWAGLWYTGILVLAGAAAVFAWRIGIFAAAGDRDRSLKFFRAAYLWLMLSMAMLVLLPAYQLVLVANFAPGSEAARIGFSHAYYGAIRHAVTVGFVSMMIVGVAARVVPALRNIPIWTLPALRAPFVLLNLGCAMRVGFQVLTDFTGAAFPLAGVSGVLEVTALAIWGVHLWRLMSRPALAPRPVLQTESTVAGLPATTR